MGRVAMLVGMVAVVALAVACGGGKSEGTATPPATSSAAGEGTPARTAPAGGASATPSAPSTAVQPTRAATPSGGGGGEAIDAAKAAALAEAAMLMPADLPPGWKVANDATQDNAAAAAADPSQAASIERCGRLTGRTMVTQPADVVTAYIGGETVSFFSTATVYRTAEGAADCAAEAATRFGQPGQLARAFGTLFTDPDAVVIAPVDFPQVADGSFAVTLSGQTDASGVVVDLVVLVVGFRKGNVSVALGSAAQAAPPTSELAPLVDKVVARLAAAQ